MSIQTHIYSLYQKRIIILNGLKDVNILRATPSLKW